MKEIPHSKPWITEEDLRAVEAVLRSNLVAQAELTGLFEQTLADWVCGAGAVGTGSGSAAVVMGLTALGVRPGHEVVLPTYVCVSVLEAVLTVGAKPVLADVGKDWVMRCEEAAPLVTSNTRAIIIPHMYGVFADVPSFRPLGIPLLEDCAQGVDARGARHIEGDVAIFSFHPTKCLTSGEGGMAASNDASMVAKMRAFRDGDGKSLSARLFSPLSNVASALGLSQLARYHEMLEKRASMAAAYRRALMDLIPESLPNSSIPTMHFRFPLKIRGGTDAYQAAFKKRGIHVRKGVDCLLHRVLGAGDMLFPRSVEHYNTTLSLPIYPALTDDERAHCLTSATEIFAACH
jgi:dTDP-4-amino-4,6-dideoxygalactose transaminase